MNNNDLGPSILDIILGTRSNTRTTEQSDIMGDAYEIRWNEDASLLCDIFNSYIIPPIVERNYPGVTSYPVVHLVHPILP